MYKIKKDFVNVYNQTAIAKTVGVAPETISRIFNGKQACSKLLAYSICKAINPNAEIENYFIKNIRKDE